MPRHFARGLVAALVVLAWTASPAASDDAPVALHEDETSFTLDNGIIRARVDKRSTEVVSVIYRGREMLGGFVRHPRIYWSAVGTFTRFSPVARTSVLVDPKDNAGRRAIVSLTRVYVPGSNTHPVDVEVRYALGRGDHGLYAYTIWERNKGHPIFAIAEARIVMQLNEELFDYICVDQNRRGPVPSWAEWSAGEELNLRQVRRITTGPLAGRIEHKYAYSAVLFDVPAYGFVSSKANLGAWIITPSFEYVAGGPAKVELTAHVGPYVLKYWKGSHYGGGWFGADSPEREWTKFVGPMLLYFNAGQGAFDPDALWADALAKARQEAEKWPYEWVDDADYPTAGQRGTVTGRIALADAVVSQDQVRNLLVGLTAPTYRVNISPEIAAWPAVVDWQLDAMHYQFWVRAQADGSFTIPHVRPGKYVLRAYADGVLGELEVPDVAVAGGQTLDLGAVAWTPKRHGRTLWEIGVPNRSAGEFRHGDHYWQWGLYLRYPDEFPNDVNFVVGQSDWRRDWNYAQPARVQADGTVRDTPWSIRFDLADAPAGKAVLRVAVCGWRKGAALEVAVNGQAIARIDDFRESGVMHRDGIRGHWDLRDLPFDATLLKAGPNVITLTLKADLWHQGVLYDYLRLELIEPPTP